MLRNWLAFVNTSYSENVENLSSDVNETVYEDFLKTDAADSEDNVHISDENVIRAYYVLSGWQNEAALDFLACELNSTSTHAENQMQLYECFARLINQNSLGYMETVSSETYLLTRVCHYLKDLGISVKTEKFQSMDKVDLLKKIWTSHYNNAKGLEIMSLICLSYNVHLPQIWNGIL